MPTHTATFTLEIMEYEDTESESGKAWVVDILTPLGEIAVEQAGVASTLKQAIEEAGTEIAHLVANQMLDVALYREEK